MCNLDYDGDPKTVYDRLSVCKEKGAVGIGELMINRRLDDPFLNAAFEAAGKLNLPVTFHMSPETGYSYGCLLYTSSLTCVSEPSPRLWEPLCLWV